MKVEEILKTKKALPAQKRLLINLMLTSSEADTAISDMLKQFELSPQQFNVLRILRGQQGKPANLNTIQDRMINPMSNTTRLVDKLLEKKLVERIVCEANRRKVEISITKKGLDLLAEIDPEIKRTEQKITQKLNQQEIKQLDTLLEKMRNSQSHS